jgi:membrane protein implicated in regulation of membrane protease activity
MDDPDLWLWIWLGAAVFFGVGEMVAVGSFFLLPFAVGAILAAFAAGFDGPLVLQWVLFVGGSLGAFLALRPLAKRLDSVDPVDGIGARRLIGVQARILESIPEGGHTAGMAMIGSEEWRVEGIDDRAVPAGTLVRVVEVRGTRAIVAPVDLGRSDDSAAGLPPTAEPPPPLD